jgi:hypothetical protein
LSRRVGAIASTCALDPYKPHPTSSGQPARQPSPGRRLARARWW